MPPSGYDVGQTRLIAEFLRSCAKALARENDPIRSPIEALRREVRHIQQDVGSTVRGEAENSVLGLTRAFYNELISRHPKDYDDLLGVVEESLRAIEEAIRSIQVPDAVP